MSSRRTEAPRVNEGLPEGNVGDGSAISVVRGGAVGKEQDATSALAPYQNDRFNVLAPVVSVEEGHATSPYLVASVSVVTLNPDNASGDVYHDFRYANEREGKFALTALALDKLAMAAGIKWIPDLCKVMERERGGDGHVYLRFQAGAGVRQPNGEWHVEVASKEIDTADIAEQLTDADRRAAARATPPDWVKKSGKRPLEEVIEERVRQQIMQIREHVLSLAETKAKNRVIRRILAIPQVLTKQHLARPFAVPRLVYRPDLTDPMALERVQIEGSRAAEQLYGSPLSSTARDDAVGSLSPPDEVSGHDGSTGAQAYGEGAEVPRGPKQTGSSAKPPAGEERSPEPPATPAGGPERPRSDPVVETGEHKGKHWSELAVDDPRYLQVIVAESGAKVRRELAQKWLDWARPSLES